VVLVAASHADRSKSARCCRQVRCEGRPRVADERRFSRDCRPGWIGGQSAGHQCVMGQRVCLLGRSAYRFIDTLRQRSYSVLIFSNFSRLTVMDSSTE
jgi:hypothetical protein